MAFERTGDILRDAYNNKRGIAAFNVFNYETIKFAVSAAGQANIPMIIQIYPGFIRYISLDTVAAVTKELAAKVSVPVGLHLDHCGDMDVISHALQLGFPSVMYDGSRLPFAENIKITQEVVKTAKKYNADVEAELGNIGSAANADEYTNESNFTDPDDALVFFDETRVSFLAVAIGNAHGDYAVLPNLDFPRIKNISDKIKIPLVLHGGSGIPDSQLQKAIKNGVAKTNVATEYFHAYYKSVQKYMQNAKREDMYSCMVTAQEDMNAFLIQKMEVLYGQGN
jgi:ketose-bisphosphate aldolase